MRGETPEMANRLKEKSEGFKEIHSLEERTAGWGLFTMK